MNQPVSDKIFLCPVTTTIEVISGKWKPRILWHLRAGSAQFGELRRATAASDRMLSKSLRELERDGIVTRTVVVDGRLKTAEYQYSDYGQTLVPVLDAVGQWGLERQRRLAGGVRETS